MEIALERDRECCKPPPTPPPPAGEDSFANASQIFRLGNNKKFSPWVEKIIWSVGHFASLGVLNYSTIIRPILKC
jgi:hypothetical protein